MKIDFEHLGGIEQGSVELNDLTLFCGKNNSGKTYVMYSLYGLLDQKLPVNFDFIKEIVAKLEQDRNYQLDLTEIINHHQEEMLRHIEECFKKNLPHLFGVKDEDFISTKIKIHFPDDCIQERTKNKSYFITQETPELRNGLQQLILRDRDNNVDIVMFLYEHELHKYLSQKLTNIIFFDWQKAKYCFLLPAERAGINLCIKELFSVRNLLLQEAQNNNADPMLLLKDVLAARYAEPVKDYMQFLNNIGGNKRIGNYSEYAQTIEKNILGGKYEVDDFGNVSFLPNESKNKLPLHFSSSTVKTLFGLVFYLEHLAKPGDYLMIDEPELNLHPDNQRQVVRVLAQLVNAGLKVIVSTHSDYFVRELNNLLMLNNKFVGSAELQKKYGYQDNELLDSKKVSAYLFDKKTITPMVLDDEGIIADTFDEVINALNQSSNKIYFAMQDAKEAGD
ncbi:AAA family ATPase [Methylovulum psychrotolerans]|uniref:AAA family ATPase n=1 Tax=Methylovulum psychrotolerans TaxID=1704499 RepID=UPI001BFF308E|nr:AAA family ATPase [Methylovulum psychrotolerans]MBT9097831.1 AAA family ATPase [Methylovulum psychrotolerans]